MEADSRKFGTQGEELDFSLPLDGLSAEPEPRITIDVACRFFATARRKLSSSTHRGMSNIPRTWLPGLRSPILHWCRRRTALPIRIRDRSHLGGRTIARWSETHARSLAKAVSGRTTGSLDTFLVAFFVTRNPKIAGSVALTEIVTKIAIYYCHERLWALIPWGKASRTSKRATDG